MKLTVNGQERVLEGVDADMPLLWAIRDLLGHRVVSRLAQADLNDAGAAQTAGHDARMLLSFAAAYLTGPRRYCGSRRHCAKFSLSVRGGTLIMNCPRPSTLSSHWDGRFTPLPSTGNGVTQRTGWRWSASDFFNLVD